MEPRVIQTSRRPAAARARIWSLQSDAMLCRAAAHGNELAYGELFRRHYPALRAFVFHLLGARHRREDSEDVAQDAFARAFGAIADQRFEGEFRRWLFTIARNRSIDLLRGERVRLVSLESSGIEVAREVSDESAAPAAVAEGREELAWLVGAIEALPERQRSALLLRELAGLSHDAIAQELETTAGSARQLITRAREGVRAAAERDGQEHALSGRSLRRELLDAAPLLPLGAAGAAASAGATAGGSFAFGKLAAAVLAALVLAGTAGPVAHKVADASGMPDGNADGNAIAPPVAAASSAPSRGRESGRGRSGSRHRSRSGFSGKAVAPKLAPHRASGGSQPPPSGADAPGSGAGGQAPASSQALAENSPAPAPPLKDIVAVPGKVVDDVTGGLNGSTPPGQAVGQVVGDVTQTVGDVTSGLLGQGSR